MWPKLFRLTGLLRACHDVLFEPEVLRSRRVQSNANGNLYEISVDLPITLSGCQEAVSNPQDLGYDCPSSR